MRKLVLVFAFCLVAVLSTLALSAAENTAPSPATQAAVSTAPALLSPQPLPAFLQPAAPAAGCSASLLSTLELTPLATLGCGECQRRSQCPMCPFGCVRDCDGFGCCVCYCS